ncbi:MAG: ABC transporter ATP-binding protein, partial [Ardenticatenaceae bacterium]
GCGKTTLLKTVAGLITPDEGRIYFDDQDVTRLKPRERGLGMLFESFALYPHLDSRANIAFPLRVRKETDVEERVQATAQRLGLDRNLLLARSPATLSAGEQQLVALGRALIANPTVLLLDEPMSKLDAHTRAHTRVELQRLAEQFDITVLYVTHEQHEAIALADRIAVMEEGRLLQIDTPGVLYLRPANVFVAQFVGSPPMNILQARVEGGHVQPEGASATLPLPPLRHRLSDGPVLLGVRPEHLEPDPDGPILIEVEQVEPLLSQRAQLVYGAAAGQPLIAQVPASTVARPGRPLRLNVATENLHLFDPRDETRIR